MILKYIPIRMPNEIASSPSVENGDERPIDSLQELFEEYLVPKEKITYSLGIDEYMIIMKKDFHVFVLFFYTKPIDIT